MPCSRETRTASKLWRAGPSDAELAAHKAAVEEQAARLRSEARQVAQAYPDAMQTTGAERVYSETLWPTP